MGDMEDSTLTIEHGDADTTNFLKFDLTLKP